MKTRLSTALVCCACICFGAIGCGGGSHHHDSAIDGDWSGDKIYGGLFCADGNYVGVGSGIVLNAVDLEISGQDEIGSPVTVHEGDCFLEGTRTAEGFDATVVSGCLVAMTGIQFRLTEDGNATVNYRYDIKQVPVEPNQIPCVRSEFADVSR